MGSAGHVLLGPAIEVNLKNHCEKMDSKGNFTKEELKRRLEGRELDLSLCSIVKVPVKQILSLQKVAVLDLSCNMISELTDSFCSLVNLEQLDLSKNSLISLPDNIGNLENLKRLDLYSNNLISLPLSFGDLKYLKWLDLKDNPLQKDLPEIVGNCLDQKDCEACAKKMLSFMLDLKNQEERRKALEVEKERKKKAEEEIEMQKIQEAKKEEKRKEKEKRRLAYLEEQKRKKQDTTSDKASSINENEISNDKNLERSAKAQLTDSSSVSTKTILMVLTVILGVIIYFYKDFVF